MEWHHLPSVIGLVAHAWKAGAADRPRIRDPCYLRMLLEDGHGNYKSVEESLVQYNSGWLEYLSSIQRVRVPILTGRSREFTGLV